MNTLLEYYILVLVIMTIWIPRGSPLKHDLCFWETFNATCAQNEVMQMDHAQYGRVSVGSCITEEEGIKMGCKRDVLNYVESVCSGRQWCQLRLPDEQLATEQEPCPRMMSYLQLQYKCVRVFTSPKPCNNNTLEITGTQGMLANSITGRTGQGSPGCPWEVRGTPGQRIRLTLHDYGLGMAPKSNGEDSGRPEPGIRQPDGAATCPIYARITEGAFKRPITLCGGETRKKVLYISETESVQIVLTNPRHSQNPKYFLLQYEVIGCPKYIPPEGAFVVKQNNEISVRCSNSGIEWRLSCNGNQWITEKNGFKCTDQDELSMPMGVLVKGVLTLPQWILIVIIIAAAVIIAVPIFVIAIISFRRRQDAVIESAQSPKMDTVKRMSYPGPTAKEYDPMLGTNGRLRKSLQGREYTSTPDRLRTMRPELVPPNGGFPPLPLPPTSSYIDQAKSTVNRRQCHPRDIYNATVQRPYGEHKYESPSVTRRARNTSDTSDPFYRELESERPDVQSNLPQEFQEPDAETLGLVQPVSTLPRVEIPEQGTTIE